MSIAEDSGVAGQIVDFRAAVEDSSTVATFNGTENAEPIRRVFLCTAREVLLIEIKAQEPKGYSGPTLQQNSVLDAVARKLARRLGFSYVNSGALYRAVAWLANEHDLKKLFLSGFQVA